MTGAEREKHLKKDNASFQTRVGESDELAGLKALSTGAPVEQESGAVVTAVGQDAQAWVGRSLSGRYRIVRRLGEGAMGEVFEAQHVHMKKAVAIKVLHPDVMGDEEVVERFKREAQAAAHIEHPHVCAATDFGEVEGSGAFFMVMEFLKGRSLEEALETAGGRFEPERALHVIRQTALALSRSHELGIIHRDLKPANIMLVQRESDRDFVKVLDFGVARVRIDKNADTQLTQAGLIYGTLTYMAPEQAAGADIDARSDLYALGVILYEMLTGQPPFVSDAPMRVASMHMTVKPPSFSEIDPSLAIDPRLEAITMKLLEKSPDDRFENAQALLHAIDAATLNPDVQETTRAPHSVDVPGRSHIFLFLGMGGLIVLLTAVVLVVALAGSDNDGSDPVETKLQTSVGAADPETPPPVPAAFDKAIEHIEAKKGKAAIEALNAMDEATRESPFHSMVLGRAHAENKSWKKAFEHFEAAIERAPTLSQHTLLLDGVFKNFNQKSDSKAAPSIALLKQHPGRASRERLAIAASSARWRNARKRALAVLEETWQMATLSEWEGLVIELRKSQSSCKARKPMVLRLGEIGHPGALPILKYWSKKKHDCDLFADCMGCVRKDLNRIIDELKEKKHP